MLPRRTFIYFTLCLGITILSCAGSDGAQTPELVVGVDSYGEDWPFPGHSDARLSCKKVSYSGITRPLVIINLGGSWYGLNGAAMGVGGYPDARELMARHSEFGTYELGATNELIEKALELCER